MILAKKVKKKLPQKIKLDFSSKCQKWIRMAPAQNQDKFLKFSTKNDYSLDISKVIFTTPKKVARFLKIFKSKNKQPQKKKFYPF